MGPSCLITINTLNKAEFDICSFHETGRCFHMFLMVYKNKSW